MGNVCTNYCCCCFKQERLEQNARCTKICWCCCKQNIEPQNEQGPVDANQVLVMSAQSAFPVNVNINELDEMSRELQQLSKSRNLKLANGVETISTTPPSAKLNSLIQLAATWRNLFDVNIAAPANQIGKDELMKTFSIEVARVFSYVGYLHLACAGFALIAFLINQFDQMNKNHQQCGDLLLKLVRFWQGFIRPLLNHEGYLIEKSVNQGIQVILECVLFCGQFLHKGRPARFIFVDSHKIALFELKEKLKDARDDINHILLFEVHSKHHQKPTQRTVGLEEQKKEVLHLLNLEDRDTIQAVVLHGMGGVGKSTLADSVYDNEIRWIGDMACSCIRLRQGFSVAELQKQMIKDLLPEENCSSVKVEELWQALGDDQRRHPVFIYIDNILEMKDLEDLLPKYMEKVQLPRGSRLMLTTRDLKVCTKVLGRNKGIVIKKHAMKCLEPKEGKELLKACAFGIPLEEHIQHEGANEQAISEELIEKIVEACGGSPLAITVLGKQLFGADNGEWERALEKLHRPTSQTIAEDQVFKVLQYSYDALDVDCQKAFVLVSSILDVFGKTTTSWTWIWLNLIVESVCPGITLETLVNYSLVEPSQFYDEDSGTYNLTTRMHDLLLSLGIQIAKQQNIITKRVQDESDFQEMVPEKRCDVQWLMVDENIEGGFPAHLLDKCERLEILILLSPLRGHLEKVPTSLKVLILARIEEDDIWWNRLASLENLVFFSAEEGCSIFPAFSEQIRIIRGNEIFPNKLVGCSRLRKLHCKSFPQFPPGFCQSMTHLRSLRLGSTEEEPRSARADDEIECPSLPQDLGRLKNLLSLAIISSELRVLPESLVELRRLRVLELRNCNKLKQLPPNFGSGLKALIYLRIESLQMTTLPEDMGNLKELQYLNLYLPSLEELPPTFTQLPNLLNFRLTASCPLKLLGGLEGQITHLGLHIIP